MLWGIFAWKKLQRIYSLPEKPVSWLSQYIGFLEKILILQWSHEIVPFISLRTHDGQMIIQN